MRNNRVVPKADSESKVIAAAEQEKQGEWERQFFFERQMRKMVQITAFKDSRTNPSVRKKI